MNRLIRLSKGCLITIAYSALAFCLVSAVGMYLMLTIPLSEENLLQAFERETGLKLPDDARVRSHRTSSDLFGHSGGMLSARVACHQIEALKAVNGTLFDDRDRFEVLPTNVAPMFKVRRRSRFTIPAGASAVRYDQFNLLGDDFFEVKAIYAVDEEGCTVHYHRDDTG